MQQEITIKTSAKSLVDITADLQGIVSGCDDNSIACNVFVMHTSCSLIISENSDPDVLLDLESYISDLVPEAREYRHSLEGQDDMPAHIRSVLTQASITIPIRNKQLNLGTWQAVYLWEHRELSHHRTIVVSCF